MKPTLHCLEEKLLLVRTPLEIGLRLVPNVSNFLFKPKLQTLFLYLLL